MFSFHPTCLLYTLCKCKKKRILVFFFPCFFFRFSFYLFVSQSASTRRVKNFGPDLRDGEALSLLLAQLDPSVCDPCNEQPGSEARAKHIIRNAKVRYSLLCCRRILMGMRGGGGEREEDSMVQYGVVTVREGAVGRGAVGFSAFRYGSVRKGGAWFGAIWFLVRCNTVRHSTKMLYRSVRCNMV